jgi:hypothetical protein
MRFGNAKHLLMKLFLHGASNKYGYTTRPTGGDIPGWERLMLVMVSYQFVPIER